MAESIQAQIEKLRASINGLEAQRNVLGDAIVEPALAALRPQLADLEQQATAQAAPADERRLVTIFFADIAGSTAMAEKLDPEEWRQVVSGLHSTLGGLISVHHGQVAQYLGDGLLAFFGAKNSTEHDSENAIRAALLAQSALSSQSESQVIQVRIGIHSGLVVVGKLGAAAHKEFTASGDAMNLAARLQSAAPPGGILISHDTYRYVKGVFDVTPHPPLTVKGKSEPVQTYLVRRAKPRPFRSVARGVAGVETRTVGREAEMQVLQSAFIQAFEQHGLVWAQLLGDAGVGKSRLVEDMNDWIELREETVRLMRARAFPDDANQPFTLIRRLWFDRFQIAEDAPLAQAEAKWVERFHEFSGREDYEEPAHALGLLVGLPFKDSPHIGAMRSDPTQVKGRALVVSRQLISSVRQQNPVVLLLEDLHWADAASWEYLEEVFLHSTTEGFPNGIFILGAGRHDWHPPEKLAALFKLSPADGSLADNHGFQIPLNPLTEQASGELAHELLQRTTNLPNSVINLVVERSEGVPYYAEEIVNWFIDHGILDTHGEQWRFLPDRLREEILPATLQHLLLTRLSSLSQPERAALQRGSIFGRRFWTGGVEALGVTGGAEMLGVLQPRGFVEAQPESAFLGETEWSFHHTLLQEVTYESVLKRERAALHKVAAAWIERQASPAGRLDEFAGLLGEHYEKAGELSAAADWCLRAGRRAFAQGAPREARAFYTRTLELLPPIDRDRRWQALLGREETLFVLAEADPWKADLTALLDLAHSIGDDNNLAEAYHRQSIFGRTTGNGQLAEEASQKALAAARRCGNEHIEAKALAVNTVGDAWRGDRLAVDQKIGEAIRLARRLGDETVLAFVLFRAAYCYNELGDFDRHFSLQTEQIDLDHRLGNRYYETVGLANLGAAYLGCGLYKQARIALEQSRQIAESLGARRSLAYSLMNLSDVFLSTGDLRKAHQLAEAALVEISPSQDTLGIIYALQDLGRIALAMGDASEASRRFSETRELASSPGKVALEMESRASLAACCVLQGQLYEAGKYAHETLDYLKEHGWVGMSNPGMVYRICVETFDALGESENARQAIEGGYRALMEVADKINVPAWRQSFLENVPDHRAIMEMRERLT